MHLEHLCEQGLAHQSQALLLLLARMVVLMVLQMALPMCWLITGRQVALSEEEHGLLKFRVCERKT